MPRGTFQTRRCTSPQKRPNSGSRSSRKGRARTGNGAGPLRPRLLRAIRKISWTAKLLIVAMAIIVGYPLFDAVDGAIPHHLRQHGGIWECDLKTLGNFEFDQANGKSEDIPKEFRDLDGKRIKVTGEMWAPFRADGRVIDFDLVYSVASCCFSGPPRIQHIVKARVRGGASAPYSQGRVDAEGTLHVGVVKTGDAIDSIYRMDVDRLDPQ
jgi:hypothetical protein